MNNDDNERDYLPLYLVCFGFAISKLCYPTELFLSNLGLCIKVGCEQGDWYIWMRVWGQWETRQGNRGHQVWDAGTIYCGRGTRDVKYRDVNDYCKSQRYM